MNDESRSDRPGPPYSLGKVGVTRPSFQASAKSSGGNSASRSQRAAMGMMRSRAKRRAVSMRAFCSSVISKSIMELLARSSSPLFHLCASGPAAHDEAEHDSDEENAGDEDDVLGRHGDVTRNLRRLAAKLPRRRLCRGGGGLG